MSALVLAAAPAAAEGYRDPDALRREISADRWRAGQFKAQREKLGQDKAAAKENKQRLKDLDARVAELEKRIKENEGLLFRFGQKTPAVPAPKEAPQPQAPVLVDLENMKGADWMLMTPAQKLIYADTMLRVLIEQGIPVQKPAVYYMQAMDWMLSEEPSFGAKYLDYLFLFSVYDNEPDSRPTIDFVRGRTS